MPHSPQAGITSSATHIEMGRLLHRHFSECGPRRRNEDAALIVKLPDRVRSAFIVCDGMGGHPCGDVASRTVASAISRYWLGNPKRHDSPKKIIDAAEVAMTALDKRQYTGMGTTMSMITIEGEQCLTAHCGDSRIYYSFTYRGREISGHLRDHTSKTPEGWEYVSKGFLQGDNVHTPEIHTLNLRVLTHCRFLICTDGVYRAFGQGEIEHLLATTDNIDEIETILKARCLASARDNYTAIIISTQ